MRLCVLVATTSLPTSQCDSFHSLAAPRWNHVEFIVRSSGPMWVNPLFLGPKWANFQVRQCGAFYDLRSVCAIASRGLVASTGASWALSLDLSFVTCGPLRR